MYNYVYYRYVKPHCDKIGISPGPPKLLLSTVREFWCRRFSCWKVDPNFVDPPNPGNLVKGKQHISASPCTNLKDSLHQ